jgi:hypothetical protein
MGSNPSKKILEKYYENMSKSYEIVWFTDFAIEVIKIPLLIYKGSENIMLAIIRPDTTRGSTRPMDNCVMNECA